MLNLDLKQVVRESRCDDRTAVWHIGADDLDAALDDVASYTAYIDAVEIEPGIWDAWGDDWRIEIRVTP